mmetsp:Transcript_6867/g.19198  ORF Transcript_6867/g.19198 Transcript_6867/m.19198 type:complete len:238 (+) Transcript_6867:105-818(+)
MAEPTTTTAVDDSGGTPPPDPQQQQQQQQQLQPGEATLLVTEFPPPPFYYAQTLTPPPIPTEALERGTQRAAAAAEQMRQESERLRLGQGQVGQEVLAGNAPLAAAAAAEDGGNVVGVFGEVVENPLLYEPLDRCEDARQIRDEVQRLNNEVVKGFVNLVQDLVNRPMENKKTRDELSHNVFLMLQECNKFREHQARETLIELLEAQLEGRHRLVTELEVTIAEADKVLGTGAPTLT